MARQIAQSTSYRDRRLWALARRQHWVLTRSQMLDAGLSREAIAHRVKCGRLHPVHGGVYSVGRKDLDDLGRWMAAVLAAGPSALLSHLDAAGLWGIRTHAPSLRIELSVPAAVRVRRPGLRAHRRQGHLLADPRRRHSIPVTSPAATVIDIAPRLKHAQLVAAINQADALDLASPARIRAEAALAPSRPGAAAVARLIDRETLHLTRSELEDLFLPIARRAGLPEPATNTIVNGWEVDFHWPGLGLVVETDGGRFHRTPFQQTRDREREHAHLRAGVTPVRFTHAQVRWDAAEVAATLAGVAASLR